MSIRTLLGLSALATEVSELQRQAVLALEEETTLGYDFAFWINSLQHLFVFTRHTVFVVFSACLLPKES